MAKQGPRKKLPKELAVINADNCTGCESCLEVCPVDCIHPRKDEPEFESETKLYIHPDECIDCGACVPACPVEAIFANDEVPEKWVNFIDIDSGWFEGK